MILSDNRIRKVSIRGFSLIELIIVVAIMAVVTALIVPSYIQYVDKSKTGVLETNAAEMAKLIQIYTIDFDQNDWYGPSLDYHDGQGDPYSSLNNNIEYDMEVINNGTYENNSSIKNPYSGKMSILDYSNTLGSGDGYRPAVFLTANSSYAYEGSGSTNNIIGTVVAYFHYDGQTTDYIEVFYINKDGSKSNFIRTISQSG